MSSATDPFLPQERVHGISKSVLNAMVEFPPDCLILQTHSHDVATQIPLLIELGKRCNLRVHLSIETDRERIADLPAHGSPLEKRFAAAKKIRESGIRTVIAVAPLLPIAHPESFFVRISQCADAVILDHYIGGDGSKNGSRTARTLLPMAMQEVHAGSTELAYLEEMIAIARKIMPDRVGVGESGFAGICA